MATETTHTYSDLSVTTDTSLECNQEGEVLIRTIIKVDDKDEYLEIYDSVRDMIESLIEQYREIGHTEGDRVLAISVLGGIASELDELTTMLYDEIDYL